MKVFAKRFICGLGVLGCLLLGGCYVQSIHPFFVESAVVEEPGLLGEWVVVEQFGDELAEGEDTRFVFGEGELMVVMRHIDQACRVEEEFEATLFKVGGELMLDLYPEEGGSPYFNFHVYPVHGLVKVILSGDSLTLLPLDADEFWGKVEEEEIHLPYVASEGGGGLVTATSDEWMRFLEGYVKDERVYDQESSMILARVLP
ncbi:MAG: hypothetical protein AAGB46_14270 [Verrucomicrobiota bacterium]